jgi:hypothetical protein
MAPHPDAPAGLEQDSKGKPIPFDKRTEEDKEKVRQAVADGIGHDSGDPNISNDGGAAGPHNTPDQVNKHSTPGTGMLTPPGKSDDDDMAPSG